MLINNNIGRGKTMTEPISPDLISAAQLEHIMRSPSIATATTRRFAALPRRINLTLHRYEINTAERIARLPGASRARVRTLLYAR